ncbi:hypothetical protein JQ615_35765 [Bradyrhizobium jicamae]|uniref:Uncharacterized protein n=2 Tax=Bradyrhizobium TaxID=374 RepID=A0A1G7R1Q4_9BRAD|nr:MULTISPECIES: hypothetical protein [Bradyrhizobium]MBR0800732.1 hypothetical protein [Bradyrhizobium jicamae]SDG04696.1 hypothetical protein SAMN05216337_11142 [Bradyrhizobium brasilense]
MTWFIICTKSTSHPVAVERLHQYPACVAVELKRTKPFYFSAFEAKGFFGPFTWIDRS